MPFINDDFLLTTKAAKELYHGYAEKMPIIDYHCHLPPAEIAADQRWENIAQVWLGGDHYKWRQMRSNGIDENLITGDAPWHDKFLAFAETMEVLLKNPLFDWSHLELARYFGITDRRVHHRRSYGLAGASSGDRQKPVRHEDPAGLAQRQGVEDRPSCGMECLDGQA